MTLPPQPTRTTFDLMSASQTILCFTCRMPGSGTTRDLPPEQFYLEFGAAVRRARTDYGLSQDALASRVSLTRSSIANLESGRQRPPLHLLIDLARALHVTPSDLLPAADRDTTSQPDIDLSDVEDKLEKESDDAKRLVRSMLRAAART